MPKLTLSKEQIAKFKKLKTLNQLQKLDPIEFEHFAGWLYKQKGYQVYTTSASGDEGIDLTLKRWGRTTLVQCKRYKGNVGQPIVRDLYGAMQHTNALEGHLVTTGTISRQAEEWAYGKQIRLIDGQDLVDWLNQKTPRQPIPGRGVPAGMITPPQLAMLAIAVAIVLIIILWFNMPTLDLPSANNPAIIPYWLF
ncbi:MAG TPA: restriction endonuclease [Anaerolineae bacterium]|nr:restriction endonuclease [Anaerolineae bacterium]